MSALVTTQVSNFSSYLAEALLRHCQLTEHPQYLRLKTLIIHLEESLQLGHSMLPIAEIKAIMDVDMIELLNEESLFYSVTNINHIPTIRAPICIFNDTLCFTHQLKLEYKIRNYLTTLDQQSTSNTVLNQLDKALINQLDFYQQLAVLTMIMQPFCLIKGGAGTGKTTTLCNALVAILRNQPTCKIFVSAPTGKATHRLHQSITEKSQTLSKQDQQNLANINMLTLHRFLGLQQDSGRSFYNQKNPILCDVLAIDEASMLSNELFSQILNAVPRHCKIILLGDENQLPAVKATSFFNEITALPAQFSHDYLQQISPVIDLSKSTLEINKNPQEPLTNQQIKLHTPFRFQAETQVASYADLLLTRKNEAFIYQLEKDNLLSPLDNRFWQQIKSLYPSTKVALLRFLDNHIILSAKRQGNYSSEMINTVIDAQLRLILSTGLDEDWYVGRRIIIEKNNYQLNVYNGDIGQCIEKDNQFFIDFGHTIIDVNNLPNTYSLAFAISIHKSQGSEYNEVSIVLDKEDNPLINNSLIYTAITRAKCSFRLFSDLDTLQAGINKKSQLFSNLLALLER